MLRALAGGAPAPLRDLAAAAGLNKVTTFRILGTLVQEGFARRPPYDLGPEVAVLATALASRVSLRAAASLSLARLAAQSGDTAVLSIRSGTEAICIDRQTGDFPIQSNYLYPGTRRPLGIGAGAQALLAALPAEEADRLLDSLAGKLAAFPRLSLPGVLEQVRRAGTRLRRHGGPHRRGHGRHRRRHPLPRGRADRRLQHPGPERAHHRPDGPSRRVPA